MIYLCTEFDEYEWTDKCVLTATLTGDDVANKPVVFKNESTVLRTVNTNSNGVATYTYNSEGVGDVTFTIECMNLQETYSIEDCLYYSSESYNTNDNPYISLIGLEGFEMKFKITKNSSNSIAYLKLGGDNNNYYMMGLVENEYHNLKVYNNGRLVWYDTLPSYLPNGTYDAVFTVRNGVITWECNNKTLTKSDSSITFDTIFNITCSNGSISNIKIKPFYD